MPMRKQSHKRQLCSAAEVITLTADAQPQRAAAYSAVIGHADTCVTPIICVLYTCIEPNCMVSVRIHSHN